MHVRSRFLKVGEPIAVQFPSQELPLVGVLLDWDEKGCCVLVEDAHHVIPWTAVQFTVHDPRPGYRLPAREGEVMP